MDLARDALVDGDASRRVDRPALGEAPVISGPRSQDEEGPRRARLLLEDHAALQLGMDPTAACVEELAVDHLGVLQPRPQRPSFQCASKTEMVAPRALSSSVKVSSPTA